MESPPPSLPPPTLDRADSPAEEREAPRFPVGAVLESPGRGRGSLSAELLFNLSFLALAAVLLALWIAGILDLLPTLDGSRPFWPLGVLVALDMAMFVLLGHHLVRKLVIRPLSGAAQAATAIANGDYGRRVPAGSTREMDTLARALNRLTDQLLHNQNRLAENVRSLDDTNRLLIDTQRDLVQAEKLASIGRLAAGVAHEIGNPLGALMGYVGVLSRRGVDPDLVGGLDRESRRIDRIVRGLLQYSRPHGSPRERIQLNEGVARVLALLGDQGRLGGVEVTLRLAPALPKVCASAHDLDQVILNLIANAEEAMRGEGRLTIITHSKPFHPQSVTPARRADDPPEVNYAHLRRNRRGSARDAQRLQPGEEIVQLIVADSGPGIPADQVETIFDPFYTTRQPGEGTGLGLAIVASTVTEYGGRVEVSSADGGGAVFTLSLPIDRDEP